MDPVSCCSIPMDIYIGRGRTPEDSPGFANLIRVTLGNEKELVKFDRRLIFEHPIFEDSS